MDKKWMPTTVSAYRNLLRFKCSYTLKSNIIYNLQFMEYLMYNITTNRNALTYNLLSMTCKSYTITFISVIETIFYIEIKNRGLLPYDEYEKVNQQDMVANISNSNLKISTLVYKKTKPFAKDVGFQWLLKKIENKKIYTLLEHENYAKIKWLQKLRNKVHLHIAISPEQSDFNSFGIKDVNLANEILLNILEYYSTNDIFLSQLPFNDYI